MKRLNLLNRGIYSLFFCTTLVLHLCGVNCYIYCSKRNVFIRKSFLSIYSRVLTLINALLILGFGLALDRNIENFNYLHVTIISAKMILSLLIRIYHYVYEHSFVELLSELLLLVQDIRVLARHPNFFRHSHFVLCLVALQSMIRSGYITRIPSSDITTIVYFFVVGIEMMYILIFHLIVKSILLIFIGLIACYDELHRCTRRISNDVHTLRMAQWRMEGGQRLLLVQQLGENLEQLIAVRARMFSITVRLIKYFRFYLVVAIFYWIGHDVDTLIINYNNASIGTFWNVAIGLSNIAFYCTIYEIFVWKSKLSRSFWHLHLINYNKDFDRTVDKLLHRELVENIKVVAYGIPLNMHLFCKIFMLTISYTLMRYVYQKL